MLWAALLPDLPADTNAARRTEDEVEARERIQRDALGGLSTWCLQFTPRVALVEPLLVSPAVAMELEASVRLFGGKRRLVERLRAEVAELGVRQLAWAPTSLAAVAVARAGQSNGFARPLEQLLDALPIETLTSVAEHAATLVRIGCRTLGEVRALPRGGLARRFDGTLLAALDRAYGLAPDVHAWVQLPERFQGRLELMARVEHAPALLFGARRLLVQMCGWLAARHAATSAFTLAWCHDAMRSKSAGTGGRLTVRTATPTRDIEHLIRLLAEHLAKVELLAPVGDLELIDVEVQAAEQPSLSLLPETRDPGESLTLVIERIAARLGPERVLRPVPLEDHRVEWMCHWQPSPGVRRTVKAARAVDLPQPTFLLPDPVRLAMRGERPMYQGVLQLLTGPHRVEGGWWDRVVDGSVNVRGGGGDERTSGTAIASRHVARDYWVALSEHAGVLWIFQTRLAGGTASFETAWFLHGVFA